MAARDEILARLASDPDPAGVTPRWEKKRGFEELPLVYENALKSVHGEVVRARSLKDAAVLLSNRIKIERAERVILNGDSPIDLNRLRDDLPGVEVRPVGDGSSRENAVLMRDFCAQADIGVSGAEALIAETGTAVIRSGRHLSRLATLLPPVHIVVAAASLIVPDLFAWTAAREPVWPANVTLVSGPSKTADIEQTMAIGVHGPKKFIVILFEEGGN